MNYVWPLQNPSDSASPILSLVFMYRDGMYNFDKEYYVYDGSRFTADIGGYLGLMLGHSLLSIYSISTRWIWGLRNTIKNWISPNNSE